MKINKVKYALLSLLILVNCFKLKITNNLVSEPLPMIKI